MTARRAVLAALALMAAAFAPPPGHAQPPMWIAHGRRATVIMFGSVHLLPPGLDWKSPALDAALQSADEVWFELPIDMETDAQALRLSRRRGYLPPGDRLSAHLTAEQNARLQKVCGALQIPPAVLEPLRPWLAEVSLSLAIDAKAGAIPTEGVDQRIEETAPPAARRRAFETPRQQIGFLADTPTAVQVASLDESLAEYIADPDAYRRLVGEWMDGNLAGLSTDALDPLARVAPTLYRRLITDRNRRWSATLGRRLRGKGEAVVVVGMGHLIGAQGLPQLLRARGFTVDGPS